MGNVRPCDIIIPVYNAPLELKECVDSLLSYTDLTNNRIVIINDCSPDSRVNEYLNELNNIEHLIILQNNENLGFVGTVNKGMSHSDHDVVLLNSDTVVTSRWLDKLIEVAYSDSSVATVTPLTNNGSICSVPNFLEDNSIPEGYTIDSFAHFIENISLENYPEIPTAVGFCMYIKRTVIDEVGLFDQETFGKGYGEENDFCCRVIEHGYKNVLDDRTFIFHKGSMSFQGEKLNLLKKNLKALNARYPYYEKNVHDFIVKNPLKPIQDNIHLRLSNHKYYEEVKGNVLFVLHNFFDENYNHPVGGTEYHVKDIISELKNYYAFVLVSNGNELVLKQYYNGVNIAKYHFPFQDVLTLQHFHHREYSEIIENIMGSFEISLVHIHHLIKHSFDIPYIAHKNNVKVLFTLHDYYLFCPRVNLLDENNEYCIDNRSENKCTQCLRSTYGFHTAFINKWKQEVEQMIGYVDQFITPSTFTKGLFEHEFNSMVGRITCIEHGSTVTESSVVKPTIDKNIKIWNIGFLGGLSPNKGSELIYQVITKYPKDKVNWHLIGGLGDQRLNMLSQKNLEKHGEYKREELGSIIKNLELDLVCLLSPWPETFSYTLTEAWLHDIPVLVTPMGALQERVSNVGGGWIADSIHLDDIISKLNAIIDNGQDLIKIKNNIVQYKFKTKQDMVQQYSELYDNYSISFNDLEISSRFDNHIISVALKYYLPNGFDVPVGEYHNQIHQLESELHAIRSTIGWKVLTRLRLKNKLVLSIGKKMIFIFLKLRSK